jgi:DNA polymerase-3 subunit delta'
MPKRDTEAATATSKVSDMLLHPHTRNQYDSLIREPAHALIISGRAGSGKYNLATDLISKILGVQDAHKYQFFMEIRASDPNKATISVEQIRTINDFVKRTTYGQKPIRRAVLIAEAELMTESAQNALLKLLEEPPSDTIIVLTTSTSSVLLPTVVSRSQMIDVKPVDYDQAGNWFSTHGHYSQSDITKAYAISDGRVGLMSALLENNDEHPLIVSIEQAKMLLSQSPYERLLSVDNLSKNKQQLHELLEGLTCTLLGAMKHTVSGSSISQTNSYFNKGQSVQKARQAIAQNANAKLVLTDLFLKL